MVVDKSDSDSKESESEAVTEQEMKKKINKLRMRWNRAKDSLNRLKTSLKVQNSKQVESQVKKLSAENVQLKEKLISEKMKVKTLRQEKENFRVKLYRCEQAKKLAMVYFYLLNMYPYETFIGENYSHGN